MEANAGTIQHLQLIILSLISDSKGQLIMHGCINYIFSFLEWPEALAFLR